MKYVAFLRAINVGGHVVKMEQLRALFLAMEFSAVSTYIASGNVLFESPSTDTKSLETAVEQRLHAALGYPVATFIRSAPELVDIANYVPFPGVEVNALYIGFLAEPLGAEAVQTLNGLQTETDEFVTHQREIYWLCRTKFSESKLSLTRLEKLLRVQSTLRNSTTVRKIAASYADFSVQ